MTLVVRYDRRAARQNEAKAGDINWFATFWKIVGYSLLVFVVYCVAAGIAYAFRPDRTTSYSSYDYLKASGLDAKKHYRLRLGSTSGGSYGSTSTTTDTEFFLFVGDTTTTTNGNIVPSSTARMSFWYESTSYILEIPYTKIRFHQQPNVKSWVKFTVWVYDDLDHRTQHNVGANFWTFQRGHASRKPVHAQETSEWQYTFLNDGLSAYLNKYLAWVDLYLTPAQYNAYLGSLQSAKS